MSVFGNYAILLKGEDEANQAAAEWFSNELGLNVETDSETAVEEDTVHNHVEDLWDWLEPFVASHPEVAFTIDGYIDGSEASGEFEDFRLEASRGDLEAYRSGWYEETAKDTYEGYADFCDYYSNADGSPICSEEEFDAFDGEFIRIAGSERKALFDEVPLAGPIVNRLELSVHGIR